MATEIARWHLWPGVKPEDDSSEAGQHRKAFLKVLSEQPGYQGSAFGREVENADEMRLLVHWTSVEHHITFTKSKAYGSLMESVQKLADMSKSQVFHAHLDPYPAQNVLTKGGSPVTECVTIYFPEDYPNSEKEATEADFRTFMKVIEADKGCHGSTGGWAVEKLPLPGSEQDEKCTGFVLFFGWSSIESHARCRETEAFKQNIFLLRQAKGRRSTVLAHVIFEEGPKNVESA